MRRLLVVLVATFTAVLLAGTTMPVDAAPSERALPERPITASVEQLKGTPRGVWVAIKGKATDWKNKTVIVQRKKAGSWKPFTKGQTNAKSRYRIKKFLPTGTYKFRVKVPKGNGYRVSYSGVFGGTVS